MGVELGEDGLDLVEEFWVHGVEGFRAGDCYLGDGLVLEELDFEGLV